MSAPRRIRLSRAKGWRMPDGAVKVDRSTRLGNPFVTGRFGTAKACVEHYAAMLGGLDTASGPHAPDLQHQALARAFVAANLGDLRGKDLGCWCGLCPAHAEGKPFDVDCGACAPCHADVLGRAANRLRCDAVEAER